MRYLIVLTLLLLKGRSREERSSDRVQRSLSGDEAALKYRKLSAELPQGA